MYYVSFVGNQSVLVYATLMGSIVGWDLRSPGVAWKLEHNLRHGTSEKKYGYRRKVNNDRFLCLKNQRRSHNVDVC